MKHLLLTANLLLLATSVYSQSSKTKTQLDEIQGLYEIDNTGNLSYVAVIEDINLTKEEIYNRALSYFIHTYNDANSVIQDKNEENGTIIGKGIFPNVHTGSGLVTRSFSVIHILRIDVKDNRARVIITLTNYDVKSYDLDGNMYPSNYPISGSYPFNPKGGEKNFHGQAFVKAHLKADETFLALENALRNGVVSGDLKSDDW
ncbi:DUF4468 domain-containing protein [Algoriphagus aestuariicola]|uniref:DUF4468 domain-containing protein n=1 Tax=Algoriphagus aestuariicola TaxID=1852016 RepID=A0ABS3BMJ2_9BACT|nr:DUF4468 domain-containing protein [Algoriphagus aestuariicola]MBN7800532.1 DUF4468 domain-containing protein [Algoriphagus aestuariicola]